MSWDGIKEYQASMYNALKMPYGKYKGYHPDDIPIEYCLWLRKNKIDKTIGKGFSKAIGSKIWNYKQDLKTNKQ